MKKEHKTLEIPVIMNAQRHQKNILSLIPFIFGTVLLLLIFAPKRTNAQHYFIKSYAVDNGLPTRIITDACQDKEGYMWFSTYSGISKYDGFTFTNIDSTHGLPVQHYRKIRCDEKGIIWAVPNANSGKIVFYKDNTWGSIDLPNKVLPYSYITSFEVSYNNNNPVVCIGTYTGFEVYKNNKWEKYSVSEDVSKNKVFSITLSNGLFYLATKAGLCVFDGETLSWSLDNKINTNNEAILAVKLEKEGMPGEKMWILNQHSISYLQNNKITVVADNFLLEDIGITNFPYIGIRKSGDVIFGNNFSKYIVKSSENRIIQLGVKNGFSSNGASSLFIDREENIWFIDSRGIDKLYNISLINYYETSGLPENEVTAILERNDGSYVLGHNKQISILDANKIKVIEFPGAENNLSRVLDMIKDRDGNIWISGNLLGLGKLIKNSYIQWYSIGNGLLVTSVCQDISGRIWIGTNQNLFYFKNEKIVEYEFNELLTSGVRKIFPAQQGGIYVTSLNGLWHVDKHNAKKIPSLNENQQLNAFSYFKDNKGTEFVGTMNGLFFIDKGIISRFTKNGFSITNPIYFMLQDKENYYWFGTNNGALRWNGSGSPEVFNPLNGLAGYESNRSAGLVDSKGNVWIGTDRGLSCFSPDPKQFKTPVPSVILLTTETLHGNKYSLTENTSIGYTDNSLSFNFRGISYVNEELLTYRYKLEGYDKDWREATQAMLDKIKYINVKPGKYRLCVTAKNYSSTWSEVVYSAEIIIKAPFYFSWWFIIISVCGFIGLLIIFYSLASQNLINKTLKKEIDERKLAEENLKESEQRLSFIIAGSRLGTWDWDIANNITYRNHLCSEIIGYTVEETGKSPQFWIDRIHPADLERTQLATKLHLKGKTPLLEVDYRILTKDKQYKWIQDRAKVVHRDAAGTALRMSGTHTDITERKVAADELQKSEESLRLLLASLPVAIFIAPVDPDIDLEMITGNVKTLTGFTKEEFLSAPDFWRTHLHPDDREWVLEAFKQAKEQEGIAIEYRWRLADGTYKWFHDQSIIKNNGSKKEYMGVFVDINDRKLAEQEIKDKNGQLSHINAEKDKLFSIISHDLRSPVSGLLGLTSLLSEDINELNNEQIVKIVVALNHSATKVNDLLNDLLEWSRLQRGLMVFNPVSLQLKSVVDDCIGLFKDQAKAKNIEVTNQVSDGTKISSDIHMIQVVLRNLFTNALKFTHKEGKVEISATSGINQMVRISISDTGIGINADLLEKVFKVNEKTSRKGTEGEPSSGLGLILCKEFVEKQNGSIWCESIEGEGSTFHFTVPEGVEE